VAAHGHGTVRPERQDQSTSRGEERESEHRRLRGSRDGAHRHRRESTRQLARCQGFGALSVHAHPSEPEVPNHMAQKVCAAPSGLDQSDVPARPCQLQDQTRDPRPAPDVEQRRCRLRGRGEKHHRLQHEMPHSLGAITVGGETANPLPAVELIEIRRDLDGERGRQSEPERRGGGAEGSAEVMRRRRRRASGARGRPLRPDGSPARRWIAMPHCCGRSGTAVRWTSNC
jgi:hypothetical protein